MTDTTDKAMRLPDALYLRGWKDFEKGRNYDPRGTTEWQAVVDALASSAAAPEQAAKAGPDRAERGTPCELKDCDPNSPTYRQWFPARFVATDLVGGEPIVQKDLCMPVFATWASVRFITRPSAPMAMPTAEGVTGSETAIRIWHKHCDPFRSKLGEHPPSVVINAMMEFAALSSAASSAGMDAQRWASTLNECLKDAARGVTSDKTRADMRGLIAEFHALAAIASKEQP